MTYRLSRRAALVGGATLLTGCVAGSGTETTTTTPAAAVVLEEVILRNREYESAAIAVAIEHDDELVVWAEYEVDGDGGHVVTTDWPSTAGAWTLHARRAVPEGSGAASEWPTLELSDVFQSDEETAVAVDVIHKETGRVEIDATPQS